MEGNYFNAKKAIIVWTIVCMILGFWAILPLLFGFITLKQLKRGKPATWLCICHLLFCSAVAGILLLCSPETDFLPDYE